MPAGPRDRCWSPTASAAPGSGPVSFRPPREARHRRRTPPQPASMSERPRKRELGRADRVLPGVWRLRLPLPWPGVPHGNAWAVAAGSGIVLFDTGIGGPGAIGQLEVALAQAGLRLEHVRLL